MTWLKHLEIHYPEIYKELDFWGLSQNPNIRIKDVLDHPDEHWYWLDLSRNSGIQLRDIIDHPKLPWKWDAISQNPNMTIEFAMEQQDKLNWATISSNQGITMDDIIDHPELPWSWERISLNPNITPDFVMANFKYIDFNLLSAIPFGNSKKLTKKIVETTLGLSSVPTEYAHGRLPAHLVHEIMGHAYDTSAFSLHDMIQRIAPIIEYKN